MMSEFNLSEIVLPRVLDKIYEYDESPTSTYVDGVFTVLDYLPDLEFYRYHDYFRGLDLIGSIVLLKYKVVRETESSYLIADNSRNRWIRKGASSSFCNATKEEAWASFVYRKKRQRSHLEAQLNHVQGILKAINETKREGDTLVPR